MSSIKTNPFHFKQFSIKQEISAMKVGTDGILLGAWASYSTEGPTLDIGSGTALLSLMIAQRGARNIDAVEIDIDAYREASENIDNSIWTNTITLHNIDIDLYSQSKDLQNSYSNIICNPPFFTNGIISENRGRAAARHTSQLDYNTLVLSVKRLLSADGIFSLILPFENYKEFELICSRHNLELNRVTLIRTTVKKEFRRALMEFSPIKEKRIPHNIDIEELTIHPPGVEGYSEQFKELTKEFYL